ncbi:MAG: hypothetical protein LUQ71_10415 [Methanoregula sp.]|nr:hypothetical protein [Methanoregula sp.]
MPVFECRACSGCICHLFVEDDDCDNPCKCPWPAASNEPVWKRLVEVSS